MGIEPFKIAAALVGVVAQRLIRTVCQSCKTFIYASAELLETIHYHRRPPSQFYPRRRLSQVPRYRLRRPHRHLRSHDHRPRNPRPDRGPRRAPTKSATATAAPAASTLLEQGIRLAEKEQTSLEEVMRVAYFE